MLDIVLTCHQCSAQLKDTDRFCSSCGAQVTDVEPINKDPLVGRTIGQAYLILDLIGSGGMGRVYRAEQKMLGRTVAIKFIHPHLLSDSQTVARFYTEARAASRLNHPNSVSIIDFGRTQDEMLYLVMEYLRGRDLGQLMNEDGPLPFDRLCDILISVLTALGEAHVLDVIHRDLKPENIFIERTRTGRDLVKVVDFGLAKLMSGPQATSITSPGLVCGTPDYMSPEQGRGEEIDGRGDIYSAGVLLYELLTEKLPFSADTPTKLVLKHIRDKVPNPREVAPHRNIPPELVEVTLMALEKKPADRYQTADEMIAALQKVLHILSARSGQMIECPACGKPSPKGKLYCAECGANLRLSLIPTPSQLSVPLRFSTPPELRSPMIDRVDELNRIDQLREEANGKFVSAALIGEPGIGKTRLMVEAAEKALKAGDVVQMIGPHESGEPVPYWPIITLLTSLYDVDRAGLSKYIRKGSSSYRLLSNVGIMEVLEPTGLVGTEGKSRAGAVACALARAIRDHLDNSRVSRMVLMVDDLDKCDGLTYRVLHYLPRYTTGLSLFLLSTCNSAKASFHPEGTVMIPLRGLAEDEAHALVSRTPYIEGQTDQASEGSYLPLYLEQIKYLGFSSINSGDTAVPPRLADAVANRLQKLDLSAKRILQGISVLGHRCSRPDLVSLAGSENMHGLDALTSYGFVVTEQDKISIVHPFIRDLVQAFIPAQARKELHLRALEIVSDKREPLEVRASHAYHAKETFSALMLLERVGDLSLSRGDADTAVSSYQRGLELARHDMLESGDTTLDTAIASFSYKLGSALVHINDIVGAQGVLRETLELTEPVSLERVRILIGLAKVGAMRKRYRDAYRLLSQALEIALKLGKDDVTSEVYRCLALVRKEEGDNQGVVSALKDARERQDRSGADTVLRTRTNLELVEALIEVDELEEAWDQLKKAEFSVSRSQATFLASRLHSISARIELMRDDMEQALLHYREAVRLAAASGDSDAVDEIEKMLMDLENKTDTHSSDTIAWDK